MNKIKNAGLKITLLVFGCCLTLEASLGSEHSKNVSDKISNSKRTLIVIPVGRWYREAERVQELKLRGPKLSKNLMMKARKKYSDHINQIQEQLLALSQNASHLYNANKKSVDMYSKIAYNDNKNRELRLKLRLKLQHPSITQQLLADELESSDGFFKLLSIETQTEQEAQKITNRLKNESNRLQNNLNYLKTGVESSHCGDYYTYSGDCTKTQKSLRLPSQSLLQSAAELGLKYVKQISKTADNIVEFELERLRHTSNNNNAMIKKFERPMKYQIFRNLYDVPQKLSEQVKKLQYIINILKNNHYIYEDTLQILKAENEHLNTYKYENQCDESGCEEVLIRTYKIENARRLSKALNIEYQHENQCDESGCKEVLVPTYTYK